MTLQAWERVKEILRQAMELEPAERGRFLDKACGSDAALREQVELLIKARDGVRTSFLQSAPPGTTGAGRGQFPFDLAAGDMFAERFQLVHKLSEGSKGPVWLAEQLLPERRPVALKLIKPGTFDEAAAHRFLTQRFSLDIMDHPTIGEILDAGTTQHGQHYLVMEYVPGLPITEYCDQHRLNIRERLELFILVCEGVQHAHQKAILHRNLKPANILVTEVDGKPTPHILDFGLAPTSRLGDESPAARMGAFAGTPGFMSPEQANPNARDVDTRTDVYSLGAILYVLLAGQQPFDSKQGRSPSPEELLRIQREAEPPRPSTKVSSDRLTLALTAEARSTAPGQFVSKLRGDLDWIVLRALEKDRTLRYATPSDLAADLRRYLNSEPVTARPASVGYHLRKIAQRHGTLVFGVAAVLLVLLTGIAASTAIAIRASRAREQAITERDRALQDADRIRHERDRAEATGREAMQQRDVALNGEHAAIRERNVALDEKRRADEQAATAKAESNFLETEVLAQAGTRASLGSDAKPDPDLKMRTALDRAASHIEGRFDKQPLVEASIQQTIGVAYRQLGVYPEARKHIERAVAIRRHTQGDENSETFQSISELASLDQMEGKYREAEGLYDQVLAGQRRVLGERSPDTLETKFELAIVYEELQEDVRAEQAMSQVLEDRRRWLGADHAETLASAARLATHYQKRNDFERAEPLMASTLEAQRRVLGQDHPDTLQTMHNLGSLYWSEGKYAQAEPMLTHALEIQRREMGEEHRETLFEMNSLALLYKLEGKFTDSEHLYVHALEVERRTFGEEQTDTLATMQNLGALYQEYGRYSDAEPLAMKTLEIRKRLLGEENRDTLTSMNNLANVYFSENRYAMAEPLYTRVLEIRRRTLGEENRQTLVSMNNLAELDKMLGKYSDAEPLATKTLDTRRRLLGDEQLDTLVSMHALGSLYRMEGRYAEADALLTKSLEARRKALGNEHPTTLDNLNDLAKLRQRQGRYAEAETMFAAVVDGRRRALGAESPDTLQAMTSLGEVRLKEKKYAEAETLLRGAEASYAKLAPDSWQRYRSESLLGDGFATQGKYADAEPLMTAGYRGMAGQMDSIPFEERGNVSETGQQIVSMYESWGKPDKAAEWKQLVTPHTN